MKYNITSMLSENISKTDEGFIICRNVPLARPGELTYTKDELPGFEDVNGRIVAYRDTADILSPEVMASFEGKTLAYLHPKGVDITASNWKQHSIGSVFNVRAGDGANTNMMVGDILVQDAEAINAIMNRGLREMSLGYEAQYFQESKGRVRQKNMRGNHVALVPRGRCGTLCAIQDHAAFLPEDKPMSVKDKLLAMIGKMTDADLEVVEDKGQTVATNDKAVTALTEQVGKLTTDLGTLATNLTKVVDALTEMKKGETQEERAKREEEERESVESKSNTVADADTLAIAEILAPGVQNSKTLKVDALKEAYKTADGKAAIEVFTSGKEVDYNNATSVDVAFFGAANVLKTKRVADSANTKLVTLDSLSFHKPKADTAETVNKRFDDFWNKKSA